MKCSKKKSFNSIFILVVFTSLVFFPLTKGRAIDQPTNKEGAVSIPTIKDLTQGRVKIGDTINKDNVDLVKEYLPTSTYECVKRHGMVLVMGENLPLEKLVPKFFWAATEKNKGKAIVTKSVTVYYEKEGIPWTGGLPFPEPKTGEEVMANVKFGVAVDDVSLHEEKLIYINKKGKVYRTSSALVQYAWTTHRMVCPPLGVYPGMEKEYFRRVQCLISPLEVKGLGQFSIRYYEEDKDEDTGFAYIPAFKRTLRISQTTWLDSAAGSDYTYGDPGCLNEPFAYWKFKLIGKKFMLFPATKPLYEPFLDSQGDYNPKVIFDGGNQKFVRQAWAVAPVYIVEGLPVIKHIYGKKVFYLWAEPYWVPWFPIEVMDVYDKAMNLWKAYYAFRGGYITIKGENYAQSWGSDMHDLQKGHASRFTYNVGYNEGLDPATFSFQKLLEMGR